MAKFEIIRTIRTPDGVTHESREEAEKHLLKSAVTLIGMSGGLAVQAAIDGGEPELREAFRRVYIAAFPRANKGVPKGACAASVANEADAS